MARACSGSAPFTSLHPPGRFTSSVTTGTNSLQFTVHVSEATVTMAGGHSAHSSFEIAGGARDSFLSVLKTLNRPYKPFPFFGWNRHVETIFASLFRSLPDVKLRRECLRMKDNGTVALDWVSGDRRELPPESPYLFYWHLLVRARSKGWRVVAFNSRGCADSPVTTPKFYSASFLEDLREVVGHVASCYPKSNLYAVGWSLGANILVRYLGQESHNCPLSGAVSLCNPFNLVIADKNLRQGLNIIYDKALTRALCKIFKRHALLFEDIGDEYSIPMAVSAKSVREFDEALTRVSFGFKSVDDYYSNSCSSDSIKHVRTPLLCIQAANDPMAPYQAIPHEDIHENQNCLLIVTPKGGHLGWVAGGEAPFGAPWTDPVVMEFLEHLEKGRSEACASSSKSDNLQHYAEDLQKLEV